jgi:hypothetical protein
MPLDEWYEFRMLDLATEWWDGGKRSWQNGRQTMNDQLSGAATISS